MMQPDSQQRRKHSSRPLGVWVRRAQDGDLYARDHLVRSFHSMAVGYAASLLGDSHRAEDVAQEAFVEAMHRLTTLRIPEAFPALLQSLIRKHCDRLTRRRHLDTISLEDVFSRRTDENDPMQQVQAAARREMVQQAVRELSRPDRQVVVLFYIGGHSLPQIADMLGLPVSTVKSRLHEARGRLKRKMARWDEEITTRRPDERLSKTKDQEYAGES